MLQYLSRSIIASIFSIRDIPVMFGLVAPIITFSLRIKDLFNCVSSSAHYNFIVNTCYSFSVWINLVPSEKFNILLSFLRADSSSANSVFPLLRLQHLP